MKTKEDYSGKKAGLKLWIIAGGEKEPESGEEQSMKFLGTLLHKAIELLFKYGVIPDSSDSITDEILKNSINAATALLRIEQYNLQYDLDITEVASKAQKILRDTLSHLERRFLLKELATVFPEVEVIDTGKRTLRIDLLRINRGSNLVEIFDFKTHTANKSKAGAQVKQYINAVDRFFGSSWKIRGFLVYLDPPDIAEV